jgi:ABC-2 type transporter
MRGMRRIADSGRAVCATIHQPSIAIFSSFDSLLLLKRGGEVVFFGDLGHESKNLIDYLERFPSTRPIQAGENPATWMLTTIGAGTTSAFEKQFDYAGSYKISKQRKRTLELIDSIVSQKSDDSLVQFSHKYATSYGTQASEVLKRQMTVYMRSPSYNSTRITVSILISVLFASVFASNRTPQNEGDMTSRLNSIYISVIFIMVNALNSVLSLFEVERNMFYRHRTALMYNSKALARAFTIAEIPFIVLASTAFVVVFYFVMGVSDGEDPTPAGLALPPSPRSARCFYLLNCGCSSQPTSRNSLSSTCL